MLELLGHLAGVVAQPVAGIAGDVQLAVRVGRQAVLARLLVVARALHRRVILGHVEVDGPGAQRRRHLLHGLVEGFRLPVVVLRHDAMGARGIVAQRVEERVGHVGLEAHHLGHAGLFQRLDHVLPGVHATPTDFALGGQTLTVVFGHLATLTESLGDELGVALGVFVPGGHRRGRIDADHTVGAHAQIAQLLTNAAGLAHRSHPIGALRGVTHGRSIKPNRSHHRTHHKPARLDLIGELLDTVVADVDIDMRVVKKQVHTIELHAVDLGLGRVVEHRIQIDRRLGTRPALADQSGPHRIVQLREIIGGFGDRSSRCGGSRGLGGLLGGRFLCGGLAHRK